MQSTRTLVRRAGGVMMFLAVAASGLPLHAQSEARVPVEAQAPQTQGAPTQAFPPADVRSANEVRDALREVLQQYSPSLVEVLRHDPTLLTNQNYLATYPRLAAFLQQHPEVAHNPSYFLGGIRLYDWRPDPRGATIELWRNFIEGLTIFCVFLVVTGALIWLVKSLLDYRRWLRLSRVQTEVHSKLLDRLTANEDVMAYIQSPAGRKFLESAPIPVDGPRAVNAPVGRILWSLQAGVVLAAAGLGLLYVSGRVVEEVAPALFAMGVLAVAVGAGFVISAGVAFLLSQRLGLLEPGHKMAE